MVTVEANDDRKCRGELCCRIEEKKEYQTHSEDKDVSHNVIHNEYFKPCLASAKSLRTNNPIRALVDPIVASSIKCGKLRGEKDLISLALGDPSSSNVEVEDMEAFSPCSVLLEAAVQSALSRSHTGYCNACGSMEAREAVAHHYSIPEYDLTYEDVVIASGCSGALELAITAMLDNEGIKRSTIFLPEPGFPLYQVIASSHGSQVKYYKLDPNKNWQVDLEDLDQLLCTSMRENEDVRGIVINNPSNPCGRVYSVQHLEDILLLASKYQLPILSDEVYGDITFNGAVYHPICHVAARLNSRCRFFQQKLLIPPVITASGLGKQFLVPGWRVGWLVFHDWTDGALDELKNGTKRLAQVILGASHLAQGVIPAVLKPSNHDNEKKIKKWKQNLCLTLEKHSNLCFELVGKCHGLSCNQSNGAMYLMVKLDVEKFDDMIQHDVDFAKLLLDEENVFTLPGAPFFGNSLQSKSNYYFRVMLCAPPRMLQNAFLRIQEFCSRHAIPS